MAAHAHVGGASGSIGGCGPTRQHDQREVPQRGRQPHPHRRPLRRGTKRVRGRHGDGRDEPVPHHHPGLHGHARQPDLAGLDDQPPGHDRRGVQHDGLDSTRGGADDHGGDACGAGGPRPSPPRTTSTSARPIKLASMLPESAHRLGRRQRQSHGRRPDAITITLGPGHERGTAALRQRHVRGVLGDAHGGVVHGPCLRTVPRHRQRDGRGESEGLVCQRPSNKILGCRGRSSTTTAITGTSAKLPCPAEPLRELGFRHAPQVDWAGPPRRASSTSPATRTRERRGCGSGPVRWRRRPVQRERGRRQRRSRRAAGPDERDAAGGGTLPTTPSPTTRWAEWTWASRRRWNLSWSHENILADNGSSEAATISHADPAVVSRPRTSSTRRPCGSARRGRSRPPWRRAHVLPLPDGRLVQPRHVARDHALRDGRVATTDGRQRRPTRS